MKHSYYYLISSLPMLEFGARPPISYEDFLKLCRENSISLDLAMLKEWNGFEFTLRNELARIRAEKKGKDPARYIRGEGWMDPFLAHFAHWAVHEENPLEAERFLDRKRWEKLEELEFGHYFDIEKLVVYALKLQILGRWDRINSEGGMKILQEQKYEEY